MAERALRIAQVAPAWGPVSPVATQSVEGLVARLCDALVDRGHDVTLFATGDSRTRARLRWLWPRGCDHDDEIWDWPLAEALHAAEAFAVGGEFDVVHCHTPYGLPSASLSPWSAVLTAHTEIAPELAAALRRLPQVHLVAASEYQARAVAGRPNVTVIPHGIDVRAFPFAARRRGEHLLFLGRMIADKGPLAAVAIARAAQRELILAGPPGDGFDEEIAPHLRRPGVRYVGAVGPRERNDLLAGAAALLYPIQYPEPFGLVVVEAMACGTPVLASALGAVPELVEPGLSGHIALGVEALAELVPATLALDRTRVRERVRERFGVGAMVRRHEALYASVAA